VVQGAVRGLEINCGRIGSTSGDEASNLWVGVLRDLGLLALSLQLAFSPLRRFGVDTYLARRNKA
jgi:putative oxidoreductase